MKYQKATIELKNNQEFDAEAFVYSQNRYYDGVNWLYFETLQTEKPTVDDTQLYHRWSLKDGGKLTAWLVPTSQVQNVLTK